MAMENYESLRRGHDPYLLEIPSPGPPDCSCEYMRNMLSFSLRHVGNQKKHLLPPYLPILIRDVKKPPQTTASQESFLPPLKFRVPLRTPTSSQIPETPPSATAPDSPYSPN